MGGSRRIDRVMGVGIGWAFVMAVAIIAGALAGVLAVSWAGGQER